MIYSRFSPSKRLSMEKRLVVDSGTLITLSSINRLDLLLASGLHIYIPDTVMGEVLQLDDPMAIFDDHFSYRPARKGQDSLYHFFRNNRNTVHIVQTPIFEHSHGNQPGRYVKNAGENGVRETLSMMYSDINFQGRVAVLHEDSDMYATINHFPGAESIVTSAFIRALANARRLPLDNGHNDHQRQLQSILREIQEQQGMIFHGRHLDKDVTAAAAYARN